MDHVSFDRALETLQGPIGRAIDGSRSAAFNGGRTPIDVDKVLDKIRLWLIVVLPHLPRPKPRNKQLVELNMDQECASCNYEGSLLKSGGTLTSKLLRFKAWKTGYYTNAQKWCQFAHCRNCWNDNLDLLPQSASLTDTIHERSSKLEALSLAELKALESDLKDIIRQWSSKYLDGKEDGTEKREININNKGMSTGSAEILSKHGTLKIPIKRHLLQKLKEDVELRANIQSHMVSPRLFTGDTSSIQSLLLQISDEPTAVQLKSFQRWYAEEIDGDVYSLCGFFAMLGVISLASTSEKLTEKMTAYENFMRCRQSNLSLSEYHHKFRAVVVELEIVLNTTLNVDLTAHFFMLQMAPDLQERFKLLYQTQHPGVGYEWRHMYPLMETLGRSSTKNKKGGPVDEKARKGLLAIADVIDGLEERQRSEIRDSGGNTGSGGGHGGGFERNCAKCNGETNQRRHMWWQCEAVDGRVAPSSQDPKRVCLDGP